MPAARVSLDAMTAELPRNQAGEAWCRVKKL